MNVCKDSLLEHFSDVLRMTFPPLLHSLPPSLSPSLPPSLLHSLSLLPFSPFFPFSLPPTLLPPSLPPSSQLLQDIEEMRGEFQQLKKQKSRAEASVAALEEEVTHLKSAQRRTTTSRPAAEEVKKEVQK